MEGLCKQQKKSVDKDIPAEIENMEGTGRRQRRVIAAAPRETTLLN
jgi:hypothetical protein